MAVSRVDSVVVYMAVIWAERIVVTRVCSRAERMAVMKAG